MKQHELDLKNYILSNKDVDFYDISKNYILSEEFIREFKDELDWVLISKYQKLSEKFIEEHKKYVCFMNICANQKLSEPFIEKYLKYLPNCNHYLVWRIISLHQNLSKEFIIKYFDKLNLNFLLKNENFKFGVEDILLNINGEIVSFKENNVNPTDYITK